MWLEAATSLEDASDRLKRLTEILPADYFVFDTENVRFLVPSDVGFPTREAGARPNLETGFMNRPENSPKTQSKDEKKRYVPPTFGRVKIPR